MMRTRNTCRSCALLTGLTDGRKAKAKSHNERHSHRPGSHAAGIKGHGEELLRHEERQRKHNCVANDQNNGQIPAKERSQKRNGEECAHAAGHRQDEHKVRHAVIWRASTFKSGSAMVIIAPMKKHMTAMTASLFKLEPIVRPHTRR